MTDTASQRIEDAAAWIEEAGDSMRQLADQVRENVRGLQAALETVTADRDEWKREAETRDEEDDDNYRALVETLHDVKYWFHDVVEMGRPAGDPRPMLRRIEWLLQELGE